jgi:hypothetical protein
MHPLIYVCQPKKKRDFGMKFRLQEGDGNKTEHFPISVCPKRSKFYTVILGLLMVDCPRQPNDRLLSLISAHPSPSIVLKNLPHCSAVTALSRSVACPRGFGDHALAPPRRQHSPPHLRSASRHVHRARARQATTRLPPSSPRLLPAAAF